MNSVFIYYTVSCWDYIASVTLIEWVWSIGGMILTGENRSTWRKSYLGTTVSTINVTRTDMGLNQGLCSQRPETNRLSHGTLQCKAVIFSECALWFMWIVKNGNCNRVRTFTVWEGSFFWHIHWLIFHWIANSQTSDAATWKAKSRVTNLTFMGPCIVIYFYSKTNKMHNFLSLLNITIHVSDGTSVHHQESVTVHTATGICHAGSLTASRLAL